MTSVSANRESVAPSAAGRLDPEEPAIRRIVPAKRRLTPADVIREMPVVRVLAGRDFKVKYKQSVLGPLWLVFQPLALLAAFLVAFRGLAGVQSSGVPYIVFALVGLSAWSFFQAALTIGTGSLITSHTLVRFTPCPRLAFPMASTIASLPSFAVPAAAALVVTAATGHLSPRAVLLPVGLTWLFLLTIGLVAIVSALTVRFRDIIQLMPFVLQLGLFLAPVGYPISALSSTVRQILYFNPLTGLIEAWRWMMIRGYSPSIEPIVISLVGTAALVIAGWVIFTRLETTMADEI